MKEKSKWKTSEKFLTVGGLLVCFAIGSAIIIGLTFIPWDLVIKYPRESILVLDIPLFIAGIICISVGSDLDGKGS
jgi:hypothetical protein